MSVRILLVDDHLQYRHNLRVLLEGEPDLLVVAETADGSDALQRVRESSPDLVLMDVALHGISGVEATRLIVADSPNVRVLALSLYDNWQFVSAMLEAGASGYVLKDGGVRELVRAIQVVVEGGIYLSQDLGTGSP